MKVLVGGVPDATVDQLVKLVSELSCDVVHAEDLSTVLAALDDSCVDMIFLTRYLRDGNAFKACREIRKATPWQERPIVLVTETAINDMFAKAFSAGFSEALEISQKTTLKRYIQRFSQYRRAISGRVLVVEDSESQREVVKQALKSIGLSVTCCDSVAAALACYTSDFDLVITDIVLEGKATGLDLISRIRRMEGDKGDVPIMVMSTYSASNHRIEPFRIGASDYLSKPLEINELLARSRRLVEERKLINKVREQSQKIEHANGVMAQMLGRVSHECRNSINIVLGVSKLLLRQGNFGERQTKQVNAIVNASQHQLSLLNDILDYMKLDAGHIELQEKPVNLVEFVDNVKQFFVYQCEERGLTLKVSIAADVPQTGIFDERLAQQVIINLLANAIKFTQQGEIQIRVERVQDGAAWLKISVADSGPGISAADQATLFKAFQQTESGINAGEGTGLGLALCAGFAQLMGGRMDVASKLGEGSEFSLLLPAR